MKFNILYILLTFIFVGCATTSNWPQFSGFLDDYTGMYRSNKIEGIFIIKHSSKNVNDYTKFLVDPVTVQFTPDAKAYSMNKSEIKKVANKFRSNIIRALQANHTVVDSSGKGVLLLRVAITDILKTNSDGSSKGVVEAEFIDTRTRERIAAVLTSDEGMFFNEWASILRDRLRYLNSKTKVYNFE